MAILFLLSACDSQLDRVHDFKSSDGTTISYQTQGTGDVTLVFIHCWTCNKSFWQPQIDFFKNNYQVVSLDLAGHGDSGNQRKRYTTRAFGQDVADVINDIKAERVVLIGHSIGGPVALEAADIIGDKVIGIVAVDSFFTPFQWPNSSEAITQAIEPFKKNFKNTSKQMIHSMFLTTADSKVVDAVTEQMLAANPEVAISALDEVFQWHMQRETKLLQVFSDQLRHINAASSKTLAKDRGVMIDGVGHFVPQVKPQQFNNALLKLLKEF